MTLFDETAALIQWPEGVRSVRHGSTSLHLDFPNLPTSVIVETVYQRPDGGAVCFSVPLDHRMLLTGSLDEIRKDLSARMKDRLDECRRKYGGMIMPETKKGRKIMAAMRKQYGEKKGMQVFYASENKGTIKGVHGRRRKKRRKGSH